jgi:hypothetical protein
MIYAQDTGQLSTDKQATIGIGYAGNGPGLNNPGMQDVHNVGPLPVGWYTVGQAYHHPRLGPETMELEPDPENEMFGRSGFAMHGRRFIGDMNASEGCIVLDLPARHIVAMGTDRRLHVVSEDLTG